MHQIVVITMNGEETQFVIRNWTVVQAVINDSVNQVSLASTLASSKPLLLHFIQIHL